MPAEATSVVSPTSPRGVFLRHKQQNRQVSPEARPSSTFRGNGDAGSGPSRRLAGVDEREGYLHERTQQWIQQEADAHFGGDWGAAATAILRAAHAAELFPDDPWAGIRTRVQRRSGQPGPRNPALTSTGAWPIHDEGAPPRAPAKS